SLAKFGGADSVTAMRKTRDHEEAVETGCTTFHSSLHGFEVVDATLRRDGGIAPAVILDEFAAAGFGGSEIGVLGADEAGIFVGELDVRIEIERAEVPMRVVKDDVAEEGVSEEPGEGRLIGTGSASGEPERPVDSNRFGAGSIAGENLFVGAWVSGTLVDLLCRADLSGGEAIGAVARLALDHDGIEMAEIGIFENVVRDAVELVAGSDGGFLQDGE